MDLVEKEKLAVAKISKEYKPWRSLSKAEKKMRKWIEKGCPRLAWNSSKNGTFKRGQ